MVQRGILRKNSKRWNFVTYSHALSVETRQLVKRRSTRRQRRLRCQRVTNLSLSLSLSLSQPRRSSWSFWATFSSSDSMAARLSISGSCIYNERRARYLVQRIIHFRLHMQPFYANNRTQFASMHCCLCG